MIEINSKPDISYAMVEIIKEAVTDALKKHKLELPEEKYNKLVNCILFVLVDESKKIMSELYLRSQTQEQFQSDFKYKFVKRITDIVDKAVKKYMEV